MSLEEILADVKHEGDNDPFKDFDKETETPSDSPAEKEQEADKPVEGVNTPDENVPFHKHPRWVEREQELKSLREQRETDAQAIAELSAFKDEVSTRLSSPSAIPDWFKELYGENDVAWQKYEQRERQREEEIEYRAVEKLEQRQQMAQEEIKYWNKWVEDEIVGLQSTGKQFDRNELIKTMLDYRPTDEHGNFDFNKGYEIYEALKLKDASPAYSKARKQIADTATKSTTGERKNQDYQTPATLRNKSWNSL